MEIEGIPFLLHSPSPIRIGSIENREGPKSTIDTVIVSVRNSLISLTEDTMEPSFPLVSRGFTNLGDRSPVFQGHSGTLRTLAIAMISAILIMGVFIMPFDSISAEAGIWTSTVIDYQGDVGQYSSIAIDSDGDIHISYYDQTNESLRYASKTSGQWNRIEVDSEMSTGTWTSIAVDSGGNSHISYMSSTYGELKYATDAGVGWSNQTVDDSAIVGRYSSIALDEEEKVHISYHDTTHNDLKYATNVNGFWEDLTVDNEGDTGLYTSICVDSQGAVHISYYDLTNKSLKYASNAGGDWQNQTIDDAGNVGTYTSIALDSSDMVHISYCDETQLDLKHATNSDGVWTVNTVDSDGQVGRYSSLVIDSSGNAHISYQKVDSLDLKYATNSGGTWATEVAESAGDVGFWTSIALAPNGYPFISHYDQEDQSLLLTNIRQGPPSAPMDLTADPGNGYVSLSWEPPLDTGGFPITEYFVHRGTNPEQLVNLGPIGNVTDYNDNTVDNGVTYYYGVSAFNLLGEGELSELVQTTPYGTPSPPGNLQAHLVDGQVILDWLIPSDDGGKPVENYRIYRGPSAAQLSLLTTIGNHTEYTDGNVSEGNTYVYRVAAVNEVGEGQYSLAAQVTWNGGSDLDLTLIIGIVMVVAVVAVVALLLLRRLRS